MVTSSLFSLDEDIWYRNKSVHIASRGAMRAWACRGASFPLLAVLPDQRQVRDFAEDSKVMGILDSILVLPELPFTDDEDKLRAIKAARGGILSSFRKNHGVLACTPSALMTPFSLGGDFFNIETGKETPRDALISWLTENGYAKNDLVWFPGQFAFRGSIVDVFSPSCAFPARIEFFDDEVLSVRFFMPDTQKTLRKIETLSLQSLNSRFSLAHEIQEFLPKDMRIIYFDPKGLDVSAENSAWLWDGLDNKLKNTISLKSWEDLCVIFSSYNRLRVQPDVYNCTARLAIRKFPDFKGNFKEVNAYCSVLAKEGCSISVFSESEKTLKWATECGYEAKKATISEGFVDISENKAVISDLELSGVSISRYRLENSAPNDWGSGLIAGQWVVHDDYGVSKYLGSEIVNTLEGDREYLVLLFASDKRLLIPVMHFHKISPWSALPGQEAAADDLKSQAWRKSAAKARELAEQAAKELVEIYATREVTKGFPFMANRELMKDIEDSFLYTETADQRSAIKAVESDMESAVPMDRLVVGDVGFGKTEVAVRAAAKAVFSGKQVAVMVPTTLLAQQHYETFSARFSSLAVRVEVISRFVPYAKQKKIVQDIAEGKVDIVIGTHRLVSSDISFKDIGLVVIDEEHRFGVMHKEHLKKTAPDVDVLMLSATPIPRSLSLSMNGLRDISVLETPPQRRLPVITVVRPMSEELLKNAVLREKTRGGQVFYVHNRIGDIQERYVMLKRMFPKLNIAVAHSKMQEAVLEKTMSEFSSGSLDILICTTIVESGLDIPSANTLIVDDAHELGLAQMYQLRGRVGRREEQAYAFLIYPHSANLSKDAFERLEAIAELDELGAGYRLAQRDLMIRGGGDLIGIAQHGNSTKVGYHKYCEILADAVSKIKGTKREQAQVSVTFPAVIPKDYLPQESLRVTLYRQLLKAEYPKEVADLREEVTDRFGRMPKSLEFLFNLAAIRTASFELKITEVSCGSEATIIRFMPCRSFDKMRTPRGWMKRLDGFIGPGGYDSLSEMAEIINEQYSVNLVE